MSFSLPIALARPTPPSTRFLFLAALLGATSLLLGTARPAFACSCAMPGPLKDSASADTAIFSGTAGLRQERGVPVEVDRWFWGEGAAPVVWLAASSFEDPAMCGTNPPPPDTDWIWLTWIDPDSRDFTTGLCSPAAMLSTAEGDAMLAEAEEAFGAIAPPTQPPPTSAPVAIPTDPPADPVAVSRDGALIGVAIGVALASLVLFGGLAVLARRRGSRADG